MLLHLIATHLVPLAQLRHLASHVGGGRFRFVGHVGALHPYRPASGGHTGGGSFAPVGPGGISYHPAPVRHAVAIIRRGR